MPPPFSAELFLNKHLAIKRFPDRRKCRQPFKLAELLIKKQLLMEIIVFDLKLVMLITLLIY